jgi:hypothetical protein
MTRRFRLLMTRLGPWRGVIYTSEIETGSGSATGLVTNTKEKSCAARLPEMHLKHRDATFFLSSFFLFRVDAGSCGEYVGSHVGSRQ